MLVNNKFIEYHPRNKSIKKITKLKSMTTRTSLALLPFCCKNQYFQRHWSLVEDILNYLPPTPMSVCFSFPCISSLFLVAVPSCVFPKVCVTLSPLILHFHCYLIYHFFFLFPVFMSTSSLHLSHSLSCLSNISSSSSYLQILFKLSFYFSLLLNFNCFYFSFLFLFHIL